MSDLGQPIGRITGVAKPDYFIFTFDPSRPVKLYDYVVVEMREEPPGSDEPVTVKVVAQVYSIERASLGLSPDHPWPVVREYTLPLDLDTPRAAAKILGYRWQGRILRPRSAPPVGSWVYRAPDKLLEEFYAVEEPRRLHIGYLISRPSVPAYLDIEGLKRHLAIIAATGAGKTWTSVVLIEELLRKNATLIVLDPHGEYVAMQRSACRKAREFCGRIRVVKGHKDQEGDTLYRVDVLDLDGSELANLAGVPSNASRIRNVIIQAKTLSEILAKHVDKRLGGLPWIKEVISLTLRALSDTKTRSGGTEYKYNLFATNFTNELLREIRDTMRLPREAVDRLRQELTRDSTFNQALQQLFSTLARSPEPALAALRYISMLEDIGIYSTSTVPLEELLMPGVVTVVNLAGLPLPVQDHIASSIMRRVFEARMRAVRGLPGEQYRYPVLIIVEEAHRFIPSQGNTRTLPVAVMIASEGRKFGAFMAVITQRPSRIDPDVLSQAQSQIILRIVNPRDQQAVRDASEQLSQELFENLPGLNPGEAIIVGPVAPISMMVRVRERVLDYAGTDISLVEAWGRSVSEASVIRRIEERLAEKLSDLMGYPVEPDRVLDALSGLLGVDIPRNVYMRGLKLVASSRVRVYRFDPRDVKVYGQAAGFDVEVGLGGGVRKCDCGADSTEREDAICPHMVAVVVQAIVDGMVVSVVPSAGDTSIIDEL
ncbi:HerA-ATP synthase with barrel domain [Pyrolobus fumarii 1A]|uniref:HerA-ATP synthase with barrel domain n=1 Tax=Pyrolobus fumarii (strain DSM 11204 / 1A) TaxID=694429 RepID=G0EDA5_PYRF1|nr:ATP-binding protein [Pyrolobus fumarii]AEM39783.1 HerA-ATP synthase with barrel domain [Pyrolobus fumarii 1A]